MKPPAFQFYADDFLAGVADMTQAEVGAYILLLCHQWGRGEIPGDAARASLIAKGKVSPHVMSKFPDGKNVRLEKERQKQTVFREAQAMRGKAGAAKRWDGERHSASNGTAMQSPEAQAQPEHGFPSPSPSPSPDITKDVGKNAPEKRSAKASPASEEEWLKSLVGDLAYAGIPVEIEHAKMIRWCLTNNKRPTRRRFVNWLNRCDRPMKGTTSALDPKFDFTSPDWKPPVLSSP